jgi:hypothetical protein
MIIKALNHTLTITLTRDPEPIREELPQVDPQQSAYIRLNNLYLLCERRGYVTLRDRLELEELVPAAYDNSDPMRDWWWSEFSKLTGWLDV